MRPNETIIEGTLRTEDLIPAFCDALYEQLSDFTKRQLTVGEKYRADQTSKILLQVETAAKVEGYYETEQASDDLDWLFSELNEYAFPGTYFGAHEDDGADFGYWSERDPECSICRRRHKSDDRHPCE